MSKSTITLQIEGSTAPKETVAGWATETYRLDGPVRGVESALPQLDLQPDTVLELQLANGTRILVAAEDAERYLGPAVRGGRARTGPSPSVRPCASPVRACPTASRARAWVPGF